MLRTSGELGAPSVRAIQTRAHETEEANEAEGDATDQGYVERLAQQQECGRHQASLSYCPAFPINLCGVSRLPLRRFS